MLIGFLFFLGTSPRKGQEDESSSEDDVHFDVAVVVRVVAFNTCKSEIVRTKTGNINIKNGDNSLGRPVRFGESLVEWSLHESQSSRDNITGITESFVK